MALLNRPPVADALRLEPIAEHHRAALKAACSEDEAIWSIYSVSYDADHFDAQFDALLARPAIDAFAIFNGERLVGMSAYINQKPAFQTLEIGNTYLAPAMRGTGFNRRLKQLMIDHAF